MVGHKYPTTAQGRLQVATQKIGCRATNSENRFCALDDAAKESFNVGNIDNAGNFAKELLAMAPDFKSNWNYGNAIQDAQSGAWAHRFTRRACSRSGTVFASRQARVWFSTNGQFWTKYEFSKGLA